jgi:Undecaprenyl-phosphate galactose phosphotransferase WbaP
MRAVNREESRATDGAAESSDFYPYGDITRRIRQLSGPRFARAERYILLGSDTVALVLALILGNIFGWLLRDTGKAEVLFWGNQPGTRAILFGGLVVAAVAWFLAIGHYSQRRPFWDEMRDIAKVLFTVAILDAALVFLGKWPFSRLWFLNTWMLGFFLVPVFRYATKRALIALGGWRRPTAIIGIGPNALEAAAALRSEPLMGYNVIAFLVPGQIVPPGKDTIEISGKSIPALPLNGAPFRAIEELGKPHLVIALEVNGINEHQKLIAILGRHYEDIHIAPAIRGLPLYGLEPLHFFSHEVLFLRTRNNLTRQWARAAKRVFDFTGAVLLLLLFAPLFGYISLRIWREDGGAIFFTQNRVGKDGSVFRVYKFRSMVQGAHNMLLSWLEDKPDVRAEYENNNFKLRNDPRVTKIGRWLRRSSFDELPQLWNVLKGEMSLVGPRPLLERELPQYGETIELYNEARPGITGLWQISGRSETKFSDRANLDAWYVRNWSLWYDIVILIRTIKVVWSKNGAY